VEHGQRSSRAPRHRARRCRHHRRPTFLEHRNRTGYQERPGPDGGDGAGGDGLMTGEQADGFNLDEEDRLPWLEPASEAEEAEGVPLAKVLLLVLLGLVLLAAIV